MPPSPLAAKGEAAPAPSPATAPRRGLISYDNAITLTPEQEAVRVEALTALPAPCCKEFSAATCCCRCNMKRASDGLAKHLIANLGADAVTVRTRVAAWQKAINPNGFSGDTCPRCCGRSFRTTARRHEPGHLSSEPAGGQARPAPSVAS